MHYGIIRRRASGVRRQKTNQGAGLRMGAFMLLSMAFVPSCQCGNFSSPNPTEVSSASVPTASAPLMSAQPIETSAAPEVLRFVGASHILVAYKGAELAGPQITRSKEEAKKRAEDLLAKVMEGKVPFEELAKQNSDDPTKAVGGAIGNFERNVMPPAFSDVAFALDIGQTSGIVETPRGFHIIRRTR